MFLKVRMQHRGLELYKVCINGYSGLILTYFTARSNLVNTVDFSEIIATFDLNVDRCRQLIELIK